MSDNELMLKINSSLSEDQRICAEDITASIAHARMLQQCKLISADECQQLVSGLQQIGHELAEQTVALDPKLEDIHMNIEALLATRIGAVAGKLHTGRSRNDQVATDMRLWLRASCDEIDKLLYHLIASLIRQAEQNGDLVMPGFTHLQTAQVICFGHHLGAYIAVLLRDRHRLHDCRWRINESPLGAAALAGTPHPIDRHFTSKQLKFRRPMQNAMDAVSCRDHMLEYLATLTIIGTNLSRLSEDLILWNSNAYNFVTLPIEFCSVSSIMPQKRNPDAAELIRGRCGRNLAAFNQLAMVVKALPQAYNKDLQEDKRAIFAASDNIKLSLQVMTPLLAGLVPNAAAMQQALAHGHPGATDLADWLVQSGMPFRQAYHQIRQLVQLASAQNCSIPELPKSELDKIHPRLAANASAILRFDAMLARRSSYGGAAPNEMRARLIEFKQSNKPDGKAFYRHIISQS